MTQFGRKRRITSQLISKTVQALLRHSDVKTTLQVYAHSVPEDRMLAQGEVLHAILGSNSANCGLRPTMVKRAKCFE